MFLICVLLSLFFITGVSAVGADEVKSVMEGDSVTLHTDVTHIERRVQVLWLFGVQGIRIVEIYDQKPYTYDKTDRLSLDSETGSLTITNVTSTESGVYELQIINERGTLYKRFNVTVSDHLPIPVTKQPQHLNTTHDYNTYPDETGSIRSHVYALTAAVLGGLVVFIVMVVAVKRCQINKQSINSFGAA